MKRAPSIQSTCRYPTASPPILHGASNGILTIAKKTLPLMIFGSAGYGRRQDMLTIPTRIAQALAPWGGRRCDAFDGGVGALWLSSGVSLSAFGALLFITQRSSARL